MFWRAAQASIVRNTSASTLQNYIMVARIMFGQAAQDPNTSTYMVLINPNTSTSFTSHGWAGRLVFRNLRVEQKNVFRCNHADDDE
jgi:hypothetical protein